MSLCKPKITHIQKWMFKIFSFYAKGKQAAPKHTPVLLSRSPGGPWAAALKQRLTRTSKRWNTLTMTHLANWSVVKSKLSSLVWEGYCKITPQHFPQSISYLILSIKDNKQETVERDFSNGGLTQQLLCISGLEVCISSFTTFYINTARSQSVVAQVSSVFFLKYFTTFYELTETKKIILSGRHFYIWSQPKPSN